MSCKRHPEYKGKRQPRVKCLTCYKIWLKTLNKDSKPGRPKYMLFD